MFKCSKKVLGEGAKILSGNLLWMIENKVKKFFGFLPKILKDVPM